MMLLGASIIIVPLALTAGVTFVLWDFIQSLDIRE